MILLRHGQSEFNVVYSKTRVDPGIPDPRLTEEGRRQAAEAGDRLRAHAVERLISSPYTRALQTAAVVADVIGLRVEVEPMVREHCLFHCDIGSPRSALERDWPGLDFAHLEERWWPNLDETEEALVARGRHFRRRMAERPDWERTAIITHWGFIRALTGVTVPNGHLLRFDPHSGSAVDLASGGVP